MNDLIIKTPSGEGKVEKLYVSDLGYLMLRINNLDHTYTTYNLGIFDINDNFLSKSLEQQEKNTNFVRK